MRKEDDITYISEHGHVGNHWALIIIDLSRKVSYYGDSLAWPIPSNLNQALGSSIKLIESKLKVSIWDSMSNVLQLNVSKNESNKDCSKEFYPVQMCYSVCGLCMGVLLCTIGRTGTRLERWVGFYLQHYFQMSFVS